MHGKIIRQKANAIIKKDIVVGNTKVIINVLRQEFYHNNKNNFKGLDFNDLNDSCRTTYEFL